MQTFDKKSYQRAYMRSRRQSQARDAFTTWCNALRRAYAQLLKAQKAVADYGNAGGTAPPAHLSRAVKEADRALDLLVAQHPEEAAEYFTRHEADDLQRAARALRVEAGPEAPRPRGRPPRTEDTARLARARDRLDAARTALADLRRERDALDAHPPGAVTAGERTRLQTRLDNAARREERAHEALARLTDAHQRRVAGLAMHQGKREALLAQAAALDRRARDLLAPLPVPARVPLYPPGTAPRRHSGVYAAAPVTDEALAALSERYGVAVTREGRVLVRLSDGRPVRAVRVLLDGVRYDASDVLAALTLRPEALDALDPEALA